MTTFQLKQPLSQKLQIGLVQWVNQIGFHLSHVSPSPSATAFASLASGFGLVCFVTRFPAWHLRATDCPVGLPTPFATMSHMFELCWSTHPLIWTSYSKYCCCSPASSTCHLFSEGQIVFFATSLVLTHNLMVAEKVWLAWPLVPECDARAPVFQTLWPLFSRAG